ncbi:sensor histidine kinase [Bdellovibrionota bacterium]
MEKEVSCVATQILVKFLDDKGVDIPPLLEGLPYTEDHIRDKNNWVTYEALLALYDRIQALFPKEEDLFHMIGNKYTAQRTFAFWTVIGAMVRSPAAMFSKFPFFVGKMFGIVECSAHNQHKHGMVLRYHFKDGYPPSKPFLDITMGILESGPKTFGHPPNKVEYKDIGNNSFDFEMKWEVRLPLWRRIYNATLRPLFNVSGTMKELEENNQVLQDKYDEVNKLNIELKRYIKELQESQEQLVQAGKLGAIGELASGIAHELNNPLTVVVGFTEEIADTLKKDQIDKEDAVECLEKIRYAGKRMRKMVDHLRDLSRTSKQVFEETDLNDVISNAFMMVEEQMKTHSIYVEKNLSEKTPLILGDSNELEQVLINLFTNARDAMDQLKEKDPDHKSKLIVTTRMSETEAEIIVSDNGGGIPKEKLDRIFEPFYTTKEVGKGTGLGLSIAHKILTKHNAKVNVDSEIGKGTTFKLQFPISSDTKPNTPESTPGNA